MHASTQTHLHVPRAKGRTQTHGTAHTSVLQALFRHFRTVPQARTCAQGMRTHTHITEEYELKKTQMRYYAKERQVKKEKPFEKQIFTKYQSVITIPKGYEIEDMLDMDDSVMDGDKPFYMKEVRIVFE